MSLWKRLLNGWLAITVRFGFAQTLVILTLFYAFLLGLPAIVMGLARHDPLGRRGLRDAGSAWREADTAEPDLERARQLS